MWTRFRRLISPHTFPGDEEKTRTAQILNAIIWFSILVFVLALLAMPFTSQVLLGFFTVGSMLLMAGGALVTLRAGYVKPVAWGFVLFLWLSTVAMVAFSGSIINPEVAGLLNVLMAAGMLSGIGALLTFAVLNLVAAILIAVLQVQGLLPTLLPLTPYVGLIIFVANLCLASSLLAVTVSGWRQALKRAHQYAQDLEQERNLLEQRVVERTQSLESARQQTEAARVALEAQVWQVAGLVQLSEALRGEQNLDTFCRHAVQALCKHMQVLVGGLYLSENDQLVFHGGYAFLPVDGQSRFALGEGLLGQAALDRKPIKLENIPPQYLTILSGLGQAQPGQVVLWPLVYNERLVGVLELGLRTAITNQQEQYLERAGEFISVALQTAQARQQVDELLFETQAQAGELQAREEELRAINEELLAQTEQLEARQ